MKILLASLGTRGDMEPFLAVGEKLKAKGHAITCLMPEQFRGLAEESGFRFKSLGTEFMEMLESPDGKVALGGSGNTLQKMLSYSKLARHYKSVSKKLLQRQFETIEAEQPDKLVHHAKTIYPYLWGINNPGRTLLLSPVPYVVHPVKEHSHVIFNRNLGPTLNKATYRIARWGLVRTILKASRQLKLQPSVDAAQIQGALARNPAVYAISPTLFARPNYWPPQIKVLGYHERDKTVTWEPDQQLLRFIRNHRKFLLVTFGSMSNPDPEKKTAVVLKSLQKHNIPAIINTAGGGLQKPSDFKSASVHFVNSIPYDWIFPKTYGVVHHGGSGTTHMALKYGCASMIIPHIIDQYLWNTIGYKKGVGPKGPAITALTEKSLAPGLLDLWDTPGYKDRAQKIACQMSREDFSEQLMRMITT